MFGSPSYTLVKNEDEEDSSKNYVPTGPKFGTWVTPISITITVACAFVNVCLVALLYSNTWLGVQQYQDEHGGLKANSTYIGLDRLYANATAFKSYPPIRNQARRFFQISSSHPRKQLALEAPKVVGPTGFIPSAHGFYQILVTSEISTLVEFRAIDYGMENCNLILKIPSSNTTEQATMVSEGDLEVWELGDPNARIDRKTISWDARPRRSRLIATTQIHYGVSQTYESFKCLSGTHLTFELACKGCHLNFTRTSDKVHDAFYIIQSQTIL